MNGAYQRKWADTSSARFDPRHLDVSSIVFCSPTIAVKDQMYPSCVGRLLRLTLLAPNIVEAILDGRQPAE